MARLYWVPLCFVEQNTNKRENLKYATFRIVSFALCSLHAGVKMVKHYTASLLTSLAADNKILALHKEGCDSYGRRLCSEVSIIPSVMSRYVQRIEDDITKSKISMYPTHKMYSSALFFAIFAS